VFPCLCDPMAGNLRFRTLKDSAGFELMAQDMGRFFQSRGVLAHPWVLTLVAALRYGANSVEIDGAVHTVDHDIDLRLVIPNNMTFPALMEDLEDFLWNAGHWVKAFPCGLPKVGQHNPALLFFGTPTAAGWMQATNLMPHVLSLRTAKSAPMLAPVVGFMAQILGLILAPIWALVVDVDFHVEWAEPGSAALGADPSRSVLWAGHRWPFPRFGAEVFRARFTDYVGSLPHGDQKVKKKLLGFCDFYRPRSPPSWREDLSESAAANATAHFCGSALRSEGYFSFWELCSDSSKVPEEGAHWPEDVRAQKKPQDWCGTPKLLPELQNLTQFLARVKHASASSEPSSEQL